MQYPFSCAKSEQEAMENVYRGVTFWLYLAVGGKGSSRLLQTTFPVFVPVI
jgi:hypothetical protein